MSEQRFQVAWSYCTVKILDEAGQPTIVGFTKDAIIPVAAEPEDVKRLVAKGALVKVDMPEPEKPAAKPAKEPEPEPAKAPAKAASKAGNG